MKLLVRGSEGERAADLTARGLLVTLPYGKMLGIAVIGESHGEPYLQPLEGETDIFLNGHRLGGPQWLREGDRLEIGGRVAAVGREPGALVLATDLGLVLEPTPVGISFGPPTYTSARTQRRVAAPVVLTALVLLALVMGYLFSARMVYVSIQPAPERVSFDGAFPAVAVGTGYLALSGTYRLRAERAGYKPLERDVEVTDASRQDVSFTLEKLPGYLSVETPGVTGAAVLIGGEARGTTPVVDVELAAGEA